MVKSKIVAVLLGPEGVGYLGVPTNLQSLIITFAGFGLTSSTVRELSHALALANKDHIAIAAKTIRAMVWATGLLGFLLMLLGAKGLSKLSFNSYEYSESIAILSISVLLSIVSSGQSSIIQGFRRIDLVARINVVGALFGAFASILCFYFWNMNGIVLSLIATAGVNLSLTWVYSRKIAIPDISSDWQKYRDQGKTLLVLGMPIMLSSLLTTGTNYFIRAFLSREAGLEAVGQYQAAFSFASVLVSFVLAAMGTDYLPRLTSVSDDNEKIRKEVNAQTHIALLLSVPLLAVTTLFMPYIIRIFYSSQFERAIPILSWAVLGILGKIISWPMGFIMIAKSNSKMFFLTELVTDALNLTATALFYRLFGLQGTGIAFALLYTFHVLLMLLVSYYICRFKWDNQNIKLILISLAIILVLFFNNLLTINMTLKYLLGTTVFLLASSAYLIKLKKISGIKSIKFWK